MSGRLRPAMSWLHTWTGLICGWLVFAIFITGTATVFRQEIDAWTRPVLAAHPDPQAGLQRAYDVLRRTHPDASLISITAPSDRVRGMFSYWSTPAGFGQAVLDPATGGPAAGPDTRGGDLFYRFHFELMAPYPFGRLAACIAGLFFASAVISGTIAHKRIFADFFTFRPRKGGQRAWLDGHNALGVLALPFHFLIAVTGVITLASTLMPFGALAAYHGDTQTFFEAMAPETAGLPHAAGRAAAPAPLAPMLAQARARLDGQAYRVVINNPGDAVARVTVYRDNAGHLGRPAQAVVFDGVSGRLLSGPQVPGPMMTTYNALYGLHMAEFSGAALRWLYFLGGLSGCGLIATGLVLWTVSRRRKLAPDGRFDLGFRLVEVLNAGVVMGMVLAVASFFWSSRLLPADLPARPDWEGRIFLLILAAGVLYSACRPQRRAWCEGAAAAAVLFAGAPLVSALSGGRSLLTAAAAGDWAMAGCGVVLLILGAAFAMIARRASRAA